MAEIISIIPPPLLCPGEPHERLLGFLGRAEGGLLDLATSADPTQAKIMMVTTEGGKQEVIEALMQGINSYIVKPFNEETLSGKMQSLFGN